MVIKVLSETAEIMFEDEDPEKLRIADLDCHIPRQSDRNEKHDARNPQRAENRLPVALHRNEDQQDDACEKNRDGTLGERRQGKKDVENNESEPLSSFVPGIPAQ